MFEATRRWLFTRAPVASLFFNPAFDVSSGFTRATLSRLRVERIECFTNGLVASFCLTWFDGFSYITSFPPMSVGKLSPVSAKEDMG